MAATAPQAESIFWAALEIQSPDERASYLDEACGGDQQLRAQLADQIAAYPHVEQFLEQPAGLAGTIAQPVLERPGTQIGPYRLMEQIGEGGMGLVFVAGQHHPVRRKVALKLIKPGMDT